MRTKRIKEKGGDSMSEVKANSIVVKWSDVELVYKIKEGDKKLYSQLVSRHEKPLLRVIVKMCKDHALAEDVVQEAFIKGFTKIHLFRGQSSFKSWLTKIAINTAKNKLKKLRHETNELTEVDIQVNTTQDRDMLHMKLKESIQNLVESLPSKQKRALALRVFADLSFKEIAYLMNCPYDTAKANYRHALAKLKSRIVNNQIYEGWEEITA